MSIYSRKFWLVFSPFPTFAQNEQLTQNSQVDLASAPINSAELSGTEDEYSFPRGKNSVRLGGIDFLRQESKTSRVKSTDS